MKYYLFCVFAIGLLSCGNKDYEKELERMENELAKAKSTIKNLESEIEEEGELIHIVFFDVKKDANLEEVHTEMKKLEGIDVVKDLQYGSFEDLDDDRALSEYNYVLEMSFDGEKEYQQYQAHPIHFALKENVKSFLLAPPATYDYVKQ